MPISKLHQFILFSIIGIFYSYILIYLFQQTLEFIILSMGIMVILVLNNQKSFDHISKLSIYKWMLFYIVLNLIWMILPNSYANNEDMRSLVLSTAFLFLITTLLYFDDENLSTTRKAILLITLISIGNNIFEFFNPATFSDLDYEFHIIGRSAGFYGNPNRAGMAIVFGMLMTYGIVPSKFKLSFILITFIGVTLTFSRAAIAGWFIVYLALSFTGAINKKSSIATGISLLLLAAIALPLAIHFIDINFEGAAKNILTRIDLFSGKQTQVDSSTQARLDVAFDAFNAFLNHPILGAGLSYTKHWGHQISTHNIYLAHMAEYGIIGFIIYPSLILACIKGAKGEAKKIRIAFFTYTLLLGFTTHNMLDSYQALIAFSIMAAWGYKSKLTNN